MTTTTKDINKAPSSGSAKRKLTVPATRRRSSIGCRTTSHACWNRDRFLAAGSSLGPSSARRTGRLLGGQPRQRCVLERGHELYLDTQIGPFRRWLPGEIGRAAC